MAVLIPHLPLKSMCHHISLASVAVLLVGCVAPTGRFDVASLEDQTHGRQSSVWSSPDDCCRSEESVWQTLNHDARSLATTDNTIWMGAALAGSLVVREAWDDDVRRYTARHAESHAARFGDLHDVLDACGQPAIQWGLLVTLHELGDLTGNQRVTQSSGAAMSSLGLTTAATFAIKGIADTERPTVDVSGGQFGFPSYHTSSSFALATVANQYYGKHIGLPAYGLAALVGWSRIDGRDHDLSDVVFGAALGYVIGKSVSARHLDRNCAVRLLPYIEAPEAVGGVSLETRF
ncbi:MAG: phosphatase PAP2 family protein [Planctomycetaceae bacterium]